MMKRKISFILQKKDRRERLLNFLQVSMQNSIQEISLEWRYLGHQVYFKDVLKLMEKKLQAA